MGKLKFELLDDVSASKVVAYVEKGYPGYKGKSLIVRRVVDSNVIQVLKHETASPLILSDNILN